MSELEVTPFTVIVDNREQTPFLFRGLRTDANCDAVFFLVKQKTEYLKTGDYSVEGLVDQVAVERKSLTDLFGTVGGGRERFVRELERLDAMPSGAFVVVESSWQRIINEPPKRSRLKPKTITRSVVAWSFQFPRVNWFFCAGRRHAEALTFRILARAFQNSERDFDNGNDQDSQT